MFKDDIQIVKQEVYLADGFLVLSLPNAVAPTVWRIRMDDLNLARFSSKMDANGQYQLVLTLGSGAQERHIDIAAYRSQSDVQSLLNRLQATIAKYRQPSVSVCQNKPFYQVMLLWALKWVFVYASIIALIWYFLLAEDTFFMPKTSLINAASNAAGANLPVGGLMGDMTAEDLAILEEIQSLMAEDAGGQIAVPNNAQDSGALQPGVPIDADALLGGF